MPLWLASLVFLWCYASLGVAESPPISIAAQRVLDLIEWIEIPAGEFLMGSSPEEIASLASEANFRGAMVDRHTFEAEITSHNVVLQAYGISRHEITNAQYKLFIENTRRPKPRSNQGEDIWQEEKFANPELSIVGVTWFDAQAFAEWIGCSLPSEAQ